MSTKWTKWRPMALPAALQGASRRLFIVPLTLLLVLGGCASPYSPRLPVADTGAAWSATIPPATQNHAAPLDAWWRALGDPVLDALIERLAHDAPHAQIAAARVREAHAMHLYRESALWPRLDGAVGTNRQRLPKSTLTASDGSRVDIPADHRTEHRAQLLLSYEVDLFNRLELDREASAANWRASTEEARAVHTRLRRDLILAYADLRRAEHLTAIEKARGSALEERHTHYLKRVAHGKDSKQTLRHAAEELAEHQRLLASLRREQHSAHARLAALLGSSVARLQLPPAPDYYSHLRLFEGLPGDLPVEVIARRPDLRAASELALAADTSAERTRRDHFPSLTLTSGAGLLSETLSKWLKADALTWLLGAALQSPLLDAGRQAALTAEARANAEASEAAYRQRVYDALAEAETGLQAWQSENERRARWHETLADRSQARDDAVAAQRGGRLSALDRLAAETDTLAAQHGLADSTHATLIAWAEAHRALGY